MGHKKWAILQENIYSDCWDQDARLCCLFFTHTIWPKNNQYLNRNGFDQSEHIYKLVWTIRDKAWGNIPLEMSA